TLFFREPKGRHVVSVCHNLSCHLMGAKGIIEHLTQRLRIAPGETTADGRATQLSVECLCACEQAPMMQVDDRYEGQLTADKVERILARLSRPPRRSSPGASPSPTRPPCASTARRAATVAWPRRPPWTPPPSSRKSR